MKRKPESGPSVPRGGVGTQLASTPFGFVISGAPGGGGSFRHPFQVSAMGNAGVRIARGLVDGLEPRIGKVPISGEAGKNLPPPVLVLDRAVANARGESWICVEVTLTDEGKLAAEEGGLAEGAQLVAVHRGEPTLVGKVGRHPLAQVVWGAKGPARIFQATSFNLRHARTQPAPGQGPMRHFFL